MSTPNLKHIIGKDGLHRLRLTAANGEIIDNSHEGFSSKAEAWDNLTRKLRAYRNLGLMRVAIPEHLTEVAPFPTVDERITNDPLEPQTPSIPKPKPSPDIDPYMSP